MKRFGEELADAGDAPEQKRLSLEGNSNFGSQNPHASSVNPKTAHHGGEIVFRLLCAAAKVGAVLGKGGATVKEMREESGAKIRIAEPVPGVDERVIIVSAPFEDASVEWAKSQEGLLKVHECIVGLRGGGQQEGEDLSKVTVRLLVPHSQVGCLIGKGGEIIAKMREETGAYIRVLKNDGVPACALPTDELVQVIGEASSVDKALRDISSRLRKNPPKEHVPTAAFTPTAASAQHRASPLQSSSSAAPPFAPLRPLHAYIAQPAPSGSPYAQAWPAGPAIGFGGQGAVSGHGGGSGAAGGADLSFRILCPNDKVGGVIGKGGSFVRQILEETGVRLKVEEQVGEAEERVALLTGRELPDSSVSYLEEALVKTQTKIAQLPGEKGAKGGGGGEEGAAADETPSVVTCRLVIAKNQVGCLLGKGGSIISEMRRQSHCNIRIMGRDQLPPTVAENQELLQLMGDQQAVLFALRLVAARIRGLSFSNLQRQLTQSPSLPSSVSHQQQQQQQQYSNPPLSSTPSSTTYQSPYASSQPSQPTYPLGLVLDSAALQTYALPPSAAPQRDGGGSGDGYGGGYGGGSGGAGYDSSSTNYYTSASAAPGNQDDAWKQHSQTIYVDMASTAAAAFASQQQQQQPRVTTISLPPPPASSSSVPSTTLVSIPAAAAGAVIGKGGANVAQIRSISGAKVRLYEMKEGDSERIVELVGTSDQIQSAQAVLQAFIISSGGAANQQAGQQQQQQEPSASHHPF